MINGFVSSKFVITKFVRTFRPNNNNWINDVYENIADVLEKVGVPDTFIDTQKCLKIENGRVYLDICYESIHMIEYQNLYLPIVGDVNLNNRAKTRKSAHNYAKGKINGKFLEMNVDSGEIKIYYSTPLCDEEGYPMIPKNVEFQEACVWYIMENWLMQGNVHPTVKLELAMQKVEYNIARASNDLRIPDLFEEVTFKNIWLNTQFHEITDFEVLNF